MKQKTKQNNKQRQTKTYIHYFHDSTVQKRRDKQVPQSVDTFSTWAQKLREKKKKGTKNIKGIINSVFKNKK